MRKIACLCPTYARPELVLNAAACFQRQDHNNKLLIVYDDFGEFLPYRDDYQIILISENKRCQSLPEKYNSMLQMASLMGADIVTTWDDDDIYFPWYLSDVENNLTEGFNACKPQLVYSDYTGTIATEDAAGRFHGSLAVRTTFAQSIGGWPKTDKVGFDQMMIGNCEPCNNYLTLKPGYLFRWGSTKSYHSQAVAKTGFDDVNWYSDIKEMNRNKVRVPQEFTPTFDENTKQAFDKLGVSI